jgi:RecA-family ATPase
VTSILAIVNCLLLIKTKTWLHRLNEAWLGPQEKVALTALHSQRNEILTRLTHSPAELQSAELN